MNSQLGRAGWKPTRYTRLCSAHLEELCFEIDTFSSTNGSRSFKKSATENTNVPQPKALTQRKHSTKKTVNSEREAVSKQ